jgi:glycosyltransferase involved in cell wall biosynthesis
MRWDIDPVVTAKLYRLVTRERAHVVCTNRDRETRLAGIATKLAGVPLVKRRGSDYPFPNKFRFEITYRYFVERIIANSEATLSTLIKGNPWLPQNKLVMIYNGIDPDRYIRDGSGLKLRDELGIGDIAPVISIVGLLNERKGHRFLFKSLKEISDDFPETRLLVVGEGKMEEELKELAHNLGISDRVIFLGFRDDVPAIIEGSDVLVLPSLCEGFGYVLVEAMASGKPVVATDVSSIPEIVDDGETGVLVPPGDHRRLAEALRKVLGNRELAARMGFLGRKRIKERFSITVMLDKLEPLFLEVAGRK